MKYYNDKVSKFDAVYALVGGAITCEGDNFTYHDGQEPPSDSAIETKRAQMQAEYSRTQEYVRNRQAEYPDWGTQLNKIYDDGLTKWKAEMVDPVKAKWPKDNSGPK